MQCPRCQHENRPGAKFCEECAAPLARACVNCGAQLSATAKFCSECAHPAGPAAPPAPRRFGTPETYTPKHLAERIINSKAALEGERKQVTVLFADLKGSMELLPDRDPEETRKIVDPVLEHMMEAVHDSRKMREKVTGKLLSLDRAREPTLPVFLSLLDVPVEDSEWAKLDPPHRRRRTLDALKRLFVRESQVQPALLVFEDLHWIDSETQTLLDKRVESMPSTRLLLLVNYRPEYVGLTIPQSLGVRTDQEIEGPC